MPNRDEMKMKVVQKYNEYGCELCDHCVKNKLALKLHCKKSHPDVPIDYKNLPPSANKVIPSCKKCGKNLKKYLDTLNHKCS